MANLNRDLICAISRSSAWPIEVPLPGRLLRMCDLQMINHSIDEMIDHFYKIRWPVVERGHCRDDHRARLLESQHVLEVNRR